MRWLTTNKWQRVSKPRARNLYNQGHDVYIIPCNAHPENFWIQPVKMLRNDETTFDKVVNTFSYYNCNSELGYYPAFYIPVK